MAYELFYQVAKFLKNQNLVNQPVSVRRFELKNNLDGLCEEKNNKFVTKINKKLSEKYSVDVLLHEFAHAVAWEQDADVHGPNWGKAYSKVYRLFEDEFLDD